MSALQRVDGWTVDVEGEEPRVLDLEIAERAGLAQPRNIRQLIEKNADELAAHGDLRVCTRPVQTSGGRPGSEYWLNEDQAVAVVALMRTPEARALRIALVRLFGAVRRGQLPPPVAPASPLPLDVAHGIRVGDDLGARAELRDRCAIAARATGRTLQAVHGLLRHTYRIGSIYHLALAALPHAERLLDQLALGRVLLPTRVRVLRLAARDPRQTGLPGVE